jgi:hypothetical protein
MSNKNFLLVDTLIDR